MSPSQTVRERTCIHCHLVGAHHGLGLYRACYQYQLRTGRPRPLVYATACVVCTRRLDRHRRGRICGPCYVRAHKFGLRAADIYAGRAGAVLYAAPGRGDLDA